MDPITLIVLGDPKGQPRPKAFTLNGHASVYDPATAEGWKSAIAEAVKEAGVLGLGIDKPVRFSMVCHFRRPKSHYRTGKKARFFRSDIPRFHTAKPDFDNVAKAACDALTHLSVWKDDSLVVQAYVEKRYSSGAPKTVITIQEPIL